MHTQTHIHTQGMSSIREHEQHGELIFFPLSDFVSVSVDASFLPSSIVVFFLFFFLYAHILGCFFFFFFFFCPRNLAAAPVVDYSKNLHILPLHMFLLYPRSFRSSLVRTSVQLANHVILVVLSTSTSPRDKYVRGWWRRTVSDHVLSSSTVLVIRPSANTNGPLRPSALPFVFSFFLFLPRSPLFFRLFYFFPFIFFSSFLSPLPFFLPLYLYLHPSFHIPPFLSTLSETIYKPTSNAPRS